MAVTGFFHHAYCPTTEPLGPGDSDLRAELRTQVETLVGFGQRNLFNYRGLFESAGYIKRTWEEVGFEVHSQEYEVTGEMFVNLWVEIPGTAEPDRVVVVGAHYDTVPGTAGADDNGSAVSGLLSLSRWARTLKPRKTLRFVAFVNEEPPYFMTDAMGSYVYAEECHRKKEEIEGMVCLEMLGYFSDAPGSQMVTHEILPDRGDFIALAGNPESAELVERSARAFEKTVRLPLQAAALSPLAVAEVAFSDHWSFWQFGYPAFMVTDTGPLRNPHYHLDSDLPETLDYHRFTLVVKGVKGIISELAQIN